MALIRTTPEYKERFLWDALIREGRPISEAAYIEFERNAALERSYGLPTGMLDDQAYHQPSFKRCVCS